jgi:hypothetical protein|tara:strand:- start:532 stop:1005 length:474 start_codon:yes stop_codon:yes gene_type:complete
MQSKKNNKNLRKNNKNLRKNNKTLKKHINKYIFKKSDICCEEDIDRNVVIEQLFKLYRDIAALMDEKNEYLSYINNDFLVFIDYKIRLKNKNDTQGIQLWNILDNQMFKNKKLNKTKITKLLHEVPLYLLLSFLGYADYRYQSDKELIKKLNLKKLH